MHSFCFGLDDKSKSEKFNFLFIFFIPEHTCLDGAEGVLILLFLLLCCLEEKK